jgi:hypothetical protein
MEKISTAALTVARMRSALLDLAEWAEDRLNDEAADYDRQYIAEHLIASVQALALDSDAPHAPF